MLISDTLYEESMEVTMTKLVNKGWSECWLDYKKSDQLNLIKCFEKL